MEAASAVVEKVAASAVRVVSQVVASMAEVLWVVWEAEVVWASEALLVGVEAAAKSVLVAAAEEIAEAALAVVARVVVVMAVVVMAAMKAMAAPAVAMTEDCIPQSQQGSEYGGLWRTAPQSPTARHVLPHSTPGMGQPDAG
jgi:hypothetical protein